MFLLHWWFYWSWRSGGIIWLKDTLIFERKIIILIKKFNDNKRIYKLGSEARAWLLLENIYKLKTAVLRTIVEPWKMSIVSFVKYILFQKFNVRPCEDIFSQTFNKPILQSESWIIITSKHWQCIFCFVIVIYFSFFKNINDDISLYIFTLFFRWYWIIILTKM